MGILRSTILGGLVALLMTPAVQLAADTIFSWIDDKGVRHFSDSPPSDEVTRFSRIESQGVAASAENDSRRSTYDQMVEQAQHEAGQAESARKLEDEKRDARKELERRKQLEDHIRFEQQQLEGQIQQLRQRALSRTFTEGMRAAQINALEERLQKLPDASPSPNR